MAKRVRQGLDQALAVRNPEGKRGPNRLILRNLPRKTVFQMIWLPW
jgi:hypothetical protein